MPPSSNKLQIELHISGFLVLWNIKIWTLRSQESVFADLKHVRSASHRGTERLQGLST